MKVRYVTLVLLLVAVAHTAFAQPTLTVSPLITPIRRVDWSKAGVTGVSEVGRIPSDSWAACNTAHCQTVAGGTVTATSLTDALSDCTPNTYILVPAGTFNVAGFKNTTDNCEIRGSGANQTFFINTGSTGGCPGVNGTVGFCFASAAQNWKAGPANGPVTLSGTFTKGSTTLTFPSVTNLKVGNPVILDQLDDSTDDGSVVVSDLNDANVTAGAPACSGNGNTPPCGTVGPISLEGNGGGTPRTGRQQMQIVIVTACGGVTTDGAACSGTNVSVTFAPGLAMPNWSSGKTPQAWWATAPIKNCGIRDLSIDWNGLSVPGLVFVNAKNCWAQGLRLINTNRSHVQVQYSSHITVRDTYFHLTANSLSQSYGIEANGSSDSLFENNIFQAISSPMMTNGACTGCVWAYNFQINNFYKVSGYNLPGADDHTGGIDNMLYEGNYANVMAGDVFHGSHHFVTHFRGRYTGPQPKCYASGADYASATYAACNNNTWVVQLDSYSRFYNIIGNVLGTTGTNTNYGNCASGCTSYVYTMGNGNAEGGHTTVPDDPNLVGTVFRWGNVDSATGFGSPRFNNSEVPSGLTGSQAPYKNPIPATHNLPNSFFRSAKPFWWPSGKPWPLNGPDVTGGNVANTGGHANTLPAEDCFLNVMGGPSDGISAVLPYDRAGCGF